MRASARDKVAAPQRTDAAPVTATCCSVSRVRSSIRALRCTSSAMQSAFDTCGRSTALKPTVVYGFASEHLDRQPVLKEASDLVEPVEAAQKVGHRNDVLPAVAAAAVPFLEGCLAAAQHVEPLVA